MTERARDAGTATVALRNEEERDSRDALERFWHVAERIRERNADKTPDEEFASIAAVVEEVRREQHDRDQAKGGR